MIVGKLFWQQEEVQKEDISIVLIRALQGHSGSNLIDSYVTGQCSDWEWNIPLHLPRGDAHSIFHSIINNGLIPGGQGLSRRQTVFFLPVDPRDASHKDPEYIDFSVPRLGAILAQSMEETTKTRYSGLILILPIREGLTFYQTRSNANYSSRDTSSLLHSQS